MGVTILGKPFWEGDITKQSWLSVIDFHICQGNEGKVRFSRDTIFLFLFGALGAKLPKISGV